MTHLLKKIRFILMILVLSLTCSTTFAQSVYIERHYKTVEDQKITVETETWEITGISKHCDNSGRNCRILHSYKFIKVEKEEKICGRWETPSTREDGSPYCLLINIELPDFW